MQFDLFGQWKNRVSQNTKICLVTSLILGWITHFYMLTNKLSNWDDVNNINSCGNGANIGRWFLEKIHPFGSRYSIPAVHGMLMLIFLALAACCVIEILQIKSTTASVLVSALMVTFPSIACTMTFMFTAHTYGLGIFLVCFGVLLLRKHKWGFIPGIVCLICGLGVYQSYICIAICLILMAMIIDIINGKTAKEEFFVGLFYVVVLLGTVFVYMKLCHVFYPNLDNETYGGVGNMGKIPIAEIPRLVGRCYKRFLEYFIWKPFAYMSKFMQVLNILTCIVGVILGVVIIVYKKIYRDWMTCGLLCIIAGLLPLAAAFIYLMAPEAPYSVLMLYSYVMIYVLVITLWEKMIGVWNDIEYNCVLHRVNKFVTVIVILIISLSCYENYLISNTAYMRMDITHQRVSSYFNRILANVEATSGYQEGDPVTILGEFWYVNNPSPVDYGSMYPTDSLREMSGVTLENGFMTSGVRDNYIRTFLGFNMADISGAEKQEIIDSKQYQQMPRYPQEGSISKINGVWVVKLCE